MQVLQIFQIFGIFRRLFGRNLKSLNSIQSIYLADIWGSKVLRKFIIAFLKTIAFIQSFSFYKFIQRRRQFDQILKFWNFPDVLNFSSSLRFARKNCTAFEKNFQFFQKVIHNSVRKLYVLNFSTRRFPNFWKL